MATVNTQLIDSLAQAILSLTTEEKRLLGQKLVQSGISNENLRQSNLSQFFQTLSTLPPDPEQPSLESISNVVKDVRHELWQSE